MSISENDSNTGMLQPGQIIKPPELDDQTLANLLLSLFSIELQQSKPLPSYDDRNYLVKTKGIHCDPNGNNSAYILKITNSMDSQNLDLIEGQNSMILHLHSHNFKVPYPVQNSHKTYTCLKSFGDGKSNEGNHSMYAVRLMHYIEGDVIAKSVYSSSLLFQVGKLTGNIDKALQDFTNETIKNRSFLWMLDSIPKLHDFTYAFKNQHRLAIIHDVLDHWDKIVSPTLHQLEKGFIHGDLNEQNILVCPSDEGPVVEGIIDFGDISYTYLVFELAIAIAYMSMDSDDIPICDVGGYIIRGYLQSRDIPDIEWQIIKECVCARFCQSLVLGAYAHSQEPQNDYLLETSEKGFKALQAIWSYPKADLIKRWQTIAFSTK